MHLPPALHPKFPCHVNFLRCYLSKNSYYSCCFSFANQAYLNYLKSLPASPACKTLVWVSQYALWSKVVCFVLYFWSNFFGWLPHSFINRLFTISLELMWLFTIMEKTCCHFRCWVLAPGLQGHWQMVFWESVGSSVVSSRLLVVSVWDGKICSAYYQGAKSSIIYFVSVVFWVRRRSYGTKGREKLTILMWRRMQSKMWSVRMDWQTVFPEIEGLQNYMDQRSFIWSIYLNMKLQMFWFSH